MRFWTSVALGTITAVLATGCATASEDEAAVSPQFGGPASEEQVTSSTFEEAVSSDENSATENSDSAELINFDALEEKMLNVLGDQSIVSRDSSTLRVRELDIKMQSDHHPLYGEKCTSAEEDAIAFTRANAQHMTGLISENDSLTPSNPPSVEWVNVEAFSTLEAVQTAHNLEVAAAEVCGGSDALLEETQRSIDGTVVSIVNETIGEGLFDQPFISSQEVSVQEGTVLYTYRYQPDIMAGFDGVDLSLSNDELFESAGRKLIAIADH